MKKLVLMALAVAGLSQATGCIITDESTGHMHLTWTVTLNDNAATCSEVGAAKVEVLSTLEGTAEGVADRFPCDDFEGTTGELDEGTYTVQVSILDAANEALDSFPPESGTPVTAGDTTELGTYNFAFVSQPTTVTMNLFVDYGNPGGENCTETAAGGSGVVQQQIFLYDVGGSTCIDIALSSVAGDGDTCGTTMVCTETNEAMVGTVDAGSYDIEVFGLKGAVGAQTNVCYKASQTFTINTDSDVTVVAPFNPDPADEAACNATKPLPQIAAK